MYITTYLMFPRLTNREELGLKVFTDTNLDIKKFPKPKVM